MSSLAITLLQAPLTWMDGEANLRHFDNLLADMTDRDVIILPEMFTTGFAMEAAQQALPQQQVVTWLHRHAKRTNALVGGSAAIHTPAGAVNRFLLVEPNGTLHHYDKRHLFRMADEQQHYVAGTARTVIQWRGWRILPQICYDLRFPVFSRNQNDYDLALYVANWPAPRALHWQALLLARAIENQAFVAGCNRVGSDGNQHQYSGDSQIISPQGEVLAAGEPFTAGKVETSLSLADLQAYRERFPAWRDADGFTLAE
ncbi:amidohydrolase [Pantoea stewartii]|uniref:Omega-amidase YafV n=1 Tax=Pantoea stewartii subsp. stewartii DC283 TaxID=660596 RepID=H3R9I5_PANSE|nr:amidohydrolase [Pantoea stewartii]ARF51297.1 amidohydrolase [Pantoea stewartii subsp. stewartii DC283]EHU01848.1 carbon-nitrogen hydrolase [Pantoea stewartii subsp. stewartii DC283]KAB0547627.1 amidohydrolase [Pantoea stewartii subsp. stewartii]MEB6536977.1 amidohydrolase [Pantoea stewartii]